MEAITNWISSVSWFEEINCTHNVLVWKYSCHLLLWLVALRLGDVKSPRYNILNWPGISWFKYCRIMRIANKTWSHTRHHLNVVFTVYQLLWEPIHKTWTQMQNPKCCLSKRVFQLEKKGRYTTGQLEERPTNPKREQAKGRVKYSRATIRNQEWRD